MIFRFSRHKDVVIEKETDSNIRGLNYKQQRPTSIELTLPELHELLRKDNNGELDIIMVAMEVPDQRIEEVKRALSDLEWRLGKLTKCSGCKNLTRDSSCKYKYSQIIVMDEYYSDCNEKEEL